METLTAIEAATVERCEASPMLERVMRWSSVNSGSLNPDGLDRMARLLAEDFAALPGVLDLSDPVPTKSMTADGSIRTLSFGANLYIKVRPDALLQLLFTGHMDTVYDADHSFQDVFWRKDGEILGGPGVADMKGGLAVMLAALTAVEASPLASRIGYEVVINSDEEVGSPGSAPLIRRAARRKLAAFTYEPALLPDGTLAGARPGSGNFSFSIEGRSAHAGRNPEEGRNAVVAAAELALRFSDAAYRGLKVNPARIDGGGPNNIVPDKAVLRINLRPATEGDQIRAQELIDQTVKDVSKSRDVRIKVHGGFGRPPKPVDSNTQTLLDLVRRCGADLGQDLRWRDTGGVCDGNNIAACGVPVVDTMGVRGGAIHSEDEYLIVESLAERAQLSALTILRLAARTTL
ncbi:MAG: hydrolase [Sphingosinicella sp.]